MSLRNCSKSLSLTLQWTGVFYDDGVSPSRLNIACCTDMKVPRKRYEHSLNPGSFRG
jgi:hypothetical protein